MESLKKCNLEFLEIKWKYWNWILEMELLVER